MEYATFLRVKAMASPHVQHYPATLPRRRLQLGRLLVRLALNAAGIALGAAFLWSCAAAALAI